MSGQTVKQIIETLTKYYQPDEELVITWWSKEDVQVNCEDIEDADVEDAWAETNDVLGQALDDYISPVNDEWTDSLYKYLEKKGN